MENYYDKELLDYLKDKELKNFIILPSEKMDYILKFMSENYYFKAGRVYFTGYKHERYIKSDTEHLSEDAILLFNELLQEGICNINEKIMYIGDSLTHYVYEFHLNDLLKIMPYLMNNIPQHHYFLFSSGDKLMYISFENEIQFGTQEKKMQ